MMQVKDDQYARNELCHCGSRKRYKHCHGLIKEEVPSKDIWEQERQLALQRQEAKQINRSTQQGDGKPILSFMAGDKRVVGIGQRGLASSKWCTMHDFFRSYLQDMLGEGWLKIERSRPPGRAHPIIDWERSMEAYEKKHMPNTKERKVSQLPMTGAVESYLQLANNLFQIENNKEIQATMLNRLKHPDQFQGAFYELSVLASLVKAGFEIEYEDASGASGKRCECVATDKISGRKYTVEAKSVHRRGLFGVKKNGRSKSDKKFHKDVGDQLREALKKQSDHPRIIFIEMNLPWDGDNRLTKIEACGKAVVEKADALPSTDPAMVFITNHTHQYNLDTQSSRAVVVVGFKMPDFGREVLWHDLEKYYYAKKKYADLESLAISLDKHYSLPVTFDGDIPELALSDGNTSRLLVGSRYELPDEQGNIIIGTLESGIVMESWKKAMCVMVVPPNQRIMVSVPLTDAELLAHQKYPDTFFGILKPIVANLGDGDYLGLFDSFMKTYIKSTKEQLLKLMSNHPDIEMLRNADQETLAVKCCARLVYSIFKRHQEDLSKQTVVAESQVV